MRLRYKKSLWPRLLALFVASEAKRLQQLNKGQRTKRHLSQKLRKLLILSNTNVPYRKA